MDYTSRWINSDDDPIQLISDMERLGWQLVTSYNFNGDWKVRLIFSRPKKEVA